MSSGVFLCVVTPWESSVLGAPGFQMQRLPSPLLPAEPVLSLVGVFATSKLWFVLRADDFSGIFTLVKEDFFSPHVNITALLLLLCWPICAPFSLVLTHVHRVVRTVSKRFNFCIRVGLFCFPI